MRESGNAAVRLTLAAWLCAGLAPAATLVRGPYLQNVGATHATVMWAALENGAGVVEYSKDRSFSQRAHALVRKFEPSQTQYALTYYQYQADLAGLEEGTEYFYRVRLDADDLSPEPLLRFRTAASGPVTFLVLGDNGSATPEQLEIARLMTAETAVDLLLHVGDIGYPNGTFEEFDSYYFRVYASLMRRIPFFPAPGNHEYWTEGALPYYALHAFPATDAPDAERGRYYSFDWGNVHFISLDTNDPLTRAAQGRSPMLEWLEEDLRQTRRQWKIAYFHHPPYASTTRGQETLTVQTRNLVVPILERHGVQLVLSGHEHSYQRSHPIRNGAVVQPGAGTVYVVSGGGGTHLYSVPPSPYLAFGESANQYSRVEVVGDRLTLRSIRVDGKEIDTFTLRAGGATAISEVVNAATLTPLLASGSLVRIAGEALAPEDRRSPGMPLPLELAGVSVVFEGKRLPLVSVSGSRINAQLPYDAAGRGALRVFAPDGFAETSVVVSELAPSIFPNSVVTFSGMTVTESAPAEPGTWITVYLTGLGAVNGDIGAGQPAPLSPLVTTRAPVTVHLGETVVTPHFAGLAPGFAGLYQVNFQLPQTLSNGTYLLRIAAGGVSSNTVSLPVRIRQRVEEPEP